MVYNVATSQLTGCKERQVPPVALWLQFFSVDRLIQRVGLINVKCSFSTYFGFVHDGSI